MLKKTVSLLSLSFWTSIRKGKRSLQVIIVGLGSRASTWKDGGSDEIPGEEPLRKRPFFSGSVNDLRFRQWCSQPVYTPILTLQTAACGAHMPPPATRSVEEAQLGET
jgi:hypothetical protein